MGKTYQFSDDLLRTIRRKIHKDGVTLVKNKKTGAVFLRRLTTNPTPPLTERQSLNRQKFIDRSHKASQWIKDNDPKACPPDGTLEYQKIMRSFKRQNKYKRLLYFLMAKMSITNDL